MDYIALVSSTCYVKSFRTAMDMIGVTYTVVSANEVSGELSVSRQLDLWQSGCLNATT